MAPRAKDNYGSYSDFNLNFVYGCRKVDADGGCKYCYIDRDYNLKERTNLPDPFVGKAVPFNEESRLRELDRLPHNSVIFVNGLSDTFAEFITDEQRDRWLGYMFARPEHQFMLCTKRTGLMWLYFSKREVPPNVWPGTSISRKKDLFRLPLLKKINAKVRWVSFEPLLENVEEVDLTGLSFICVGGETDPGRRYRRFMWKWGDDLLRQAKRDRVRFWYDGGNGLNDSRRGAPDRWHKPNSGIFPQERFEFEECTCANCAPTQTTLDDLFKAGESDEQDLTVT